MDPIQISPTDPARGLDGMHFLRPRLARMPEPGRLQALAPGGPRCPLRTECSLMAKVQKLDSMVRPPRKATGTNTGK